LTLSVGLIPDYEPVKTIISAMKDAIATIGIRGLDIKPTNAQPEGEPVSFGLDITMQCDNASDAMATALAAIDKRLHIMGIGSGVAVKK